ncbi:unnamed protein product [Cylicocyclus nassatus]|uniref:Uncharacterized protein n=1 Tax=Cylicocyclus nassatus TaxID=53992 RepID=A0AA36DRF4_CYLNA|nr:unnamed protein product [Cylicocyclus nassatus]
MGVVDYLLLVLLLTAVNSAISEATSNEDDSREENLRQEVNETTTVTPTTSPFVIIDEPDETEETITKVDVPTLRTRATTTRARFRKVTSSTCRTYSLSEKYHILEGVGARNQLYMAETPAEASLGFVSPSAQAEPKLKTLSADTTEGLFGGPAAPFCGRDCQMIRSKLTQALEDRRKAKIRPPIRKTVRQPPRPRAPVMFMSAQSTSPLGDAGPEIVDEGEPLGVRRGNCALAHGMCRSETLSLRVLRNRGDEICEEWVIEQIELPVACQCLLSKTSWLRSQPIRVDL